MADAPTLNEDWLRPRTWDVTTPSGDSVETLEELEAAIRPTTICDFLKLPAAEAMPHDLRVRAEWRCAEAKHLRGAHDQSSHGSWASRVLRKLKRRGITPTGHGALDAFLARDDRDTDGFLGTIPKRDLGVLVEALGGTPGDDWLLNRVQARELIQARVGRKPSILTEFGRGSIGGGPVTVRAGGAGAQFRGGGEGFKHGGPGPHDSGSPQAVHAVIRAGDMRIGRQPKVNAVDPRTGERFTRTAMGDLGEAMFHGGPIGAAIDERFGGGMPERIAGGGASRTPPLDSRNARWGFEVKTIAATTKNQKTAISREEKARKVAEAERLGVRPATILQVFDVDAAVIDVYAHEGVVSKAKSRMEHLGTFDVTDTLTAYGTKDGAGVLIWRDGRWLMQRRSDTGTWALPGGNVEAHETPWQAAVRELNEETGIDVPTGAPTRTLEFPSADGEGVYTVHVVMTDPLDLADWPIDPEASDEGDGHRWVEGAEVADLDLDPRFRAILPRLLEVKHADHDQSSHGNWASAVLDVDTLTDALSQDLPGGYRSEVITVIGRSSSGPVKAFRGAIMAPDGTQAGVWKRRFNADERVVDHDEFRLGEPHRRKGVGGAFVRQSFEAYAALGYEQVRLQTDDEGRVAWAAMDFDWGMGTMPDGVWLNLKNVEGARRDMTPREVYDLGEPGVAALRSTAWTGVYDLTRDREKAARAETLEVVFLNGHDVSELELKHMGPGPHPSGSPQAVHAGADAPSLSMWDIQGVAEASTSAMTGFNTNSAMAKDPHWSGWLDTLNDDELAAVRRYRDWSHSINDEARSTPGSKFVRDDTREDLRKAIAQVDAAIDKHPGLERRTTVYRAMQMPAKLDVGDEFVDAGFASTSFIRDKAEEFTRRNGGRVAVIEMPVGTKVAWVDGVLQRTGGGLPEYELLLPRKTRYRVVGWSGYPRMSPPLLEVVQ